MVEAADSPSALEQVEEQAPDLMVLDIADAGMSGLDVLRELRRERSGNGLYRIILRRGVGRRHLGGWTAGASCSCPNPFDPNHLLDWVGR